MRYYSSTATAKTLSSGITSSSTQIILNNLTGLPQTFPYTLVIDPDVDGKEEIVLVTANPSGTTLDITRGSDTYQNVAGGNGTSKVDHSAAAVVKHMVTARDLQEPQNHIAASSGIHGVTGSIVGTSDTQTLTNKSLTSPALTGTPTAPTAASGTNTTQIATTAFVQSAVAAPVVSTAITFEGATADAYETTLTVVDPTADRTITLPDATGTVALTSGSTLSSTTLSSPTLSGTLTVGTGSISMDATGSIDIGSTSISGTELSYLNNINTNIKTALDSKPTAVLKYGRKAITISGTSTTSVTLGSGDGYTGFTTSTNPTVTAIIEDSTGRFVCSVTGQPTATAATIIIRNVDGTSTTANLYIQWIAVGV